MRVGFVQWPDGLIPDTDIWSAVAADVARSAPEVLITNEMPFGPWLAASPNFDAERAKESVRIHENGLGALQALKVPIVISSRPVIAGGRLANEAFILERGCFRFLHQKHFFPAEEGWFESAWFRTAKPGFEVMEIDGLRIGALLCTELMFNERARAYGRAGAHLIAVPRATGRSLALWKTAGAMAAIASGSYVVSSNRTGSDSGGPTFGGGAYAFAPDGSLLSESNEERSIVVFDLDNVVAEQQKSRYPVYVAEKPPPPV
ncbi:MAG: carbon-nitrogen hydrolase family protein [Terriglobales bacterium]